MNSAYLSLGSNKGNRTELLNNACKLLNSNCGQIIYRSGVYETAAWGITAQPDFLNMAVMLHTQHGPLALLKEIHNIETILGRQRDVKWGQRTLDIDILFYNNEILNTPELIIPHPFLRERRFTLVPLAEIAPNYMHPVLNKTIKELLALCPDKLDVHLKAN